MQCKNQLKFEKGTFINPYSNEEMAGFTLNKQLSKKEYSRFELIINEYGGWWFPEVKAFLFPSETSREEFIDDYSDNYHGTEITKPILKSRGRSGLKNVLRSVYGVEILGIENIPIEFHRLKKVISEFIDIFANNGFMDYAKGKVKYKSKSDKEFVQNFFKSLIQIKEAKV